MRPDAKLPRTQESEAPEPEPPIIVEPWTPEREKLAGILTARPGGEASAWAFPKQAGA